jgi:hypothetical protein
LIGIRDTPDVEAMPPASTSPVKQFRQSQEAPVKYLILIHSNPKSRAVWETMTDEQRMEFGRGHMRCTDELAASGELVVSEGLPGPEAGKWVSVRDGKTIATDGPFPEVKEYVAGFYLVECESIDRAIEHAAKMPDAQYGEVEVRPVLDMSTWDL